MNGRSSNFDWDGGEERGRWYRASSELLLLAVGVSSASLVVASWVASALCLAVRMHDPPDGHAGDDL